MYTIKQISGYIDLQRVNQTCIESNEEVGVGIPSDSQLSGVIMLNCGGTIDLSGNLSLQPGMKCFVIDSHRPLHLGNIRSGDQVGWIE